MDIVQIETNLLKALAHPARLRIIQVLAQDEACVCHLTAILQKRQPYVSQHLMVLREAGLVVDRRDGLMVYYRLAHPGPEELVAVLRQVVLAAHANAELPTVPAPPVKGCPCPKCEEARVANTNAEALVQ